MIIKFENFINESIKNKLKGKNNSDISNTLDKYNPIEKIKKIEKNNLDKNLYPSSEEIKNYIDNFKHYTPYTLLEKSIIGRYPEGIQRALNSNKLFNKDKYLKRNKLFKDDILSALHMCVRYKYTEGFKLLVNEVKIPEWEKYNLIRKAAFNKCENIVKILAKMNLNRDDLLHEFGISEIELEEYTDKEIDDAFELIEKYL